MVAGLLITLFPFVLVLAPIIGLALSWRRVYSQSQNWQQIRTAGWASALYAFGAFMVIWISFLLWSFGLIPWYLMAAGVAVFGVIFVMRVGIRFLENQIIEKRGNPALSDLAK
jgi:hypothetical protein